MNSGHRTEIGLRRAIAPEAWALGALVLFALTLQARGPEGPALRLSYANCGEPAAAAQEEPAPLWRGRDSAERIDMRTERVWRRLEAKMRQLEERLARTSGACSPAGGMRASMFED